MKNKIKSISLVVLFLAMGIFASNAKAVNVQNISEKMDENKVDREAKVNERICNRIENVITRLQKNIGDDGIKLRERTEIRTREMEENKATKEEDLKERRTLRDQNREEFYNKLNEQAGDDSTKKAAVEKFKLAVEKAVEARRLAIDNAKKEMNNGIDQAIKNRETTMTSLRNEFEGNVESAINKAKNACDDNSSNEDLKNILNQLKSDLKSNRDSYKNKVVSAKTVQATIQNLREERKNKVKEAIENFKAAMKTAQEELRNAMSA